MKNIIKLNELYQISTKIDDHGCYLDEKFSELVIKELGYDAIITVSMLINLHLNDGRISQANKIWALNITSDEAEIDSNLHICHLNHLANKLRYMI